MKQQFPTEREAKRQALLQAVDNMRDILTTCADEAEAIRTLPQASVAAQCNLPHGLQAARGAPASDGVFPASPYLAVAFL